MHHFIRNKDSFHSSDRGCPQITPASDERTKRRHDSELNVDVIVVVLVVGIGHYKLARREGFEYKRCFDANIQRTTDPNSDIAQCSLLNLYRYQDFMQDLNLN